MSLNPQNKLKRKRIKRRNIVSEFYLKCYSINKIIDEIEKKTGERCCAATVYSDIKKLKEIWRNEQIKNIDAAINIECARIDDIILKLWKQWEKSCEDYDSILQNIIETPAKGVVRIEKKIQKIKAIGAVNIISEIRNQMIEKRKLLGLYKNADNVEKTERLETLLNEIAKTLQ